MAYICTKGKGCCNPRDCAQCRWDEDRQAYSCWAVADEKAKYRDRLTDEEWNAITHLTNTTKLDTVFDLVQVEFDTDPDCWWDFDNDCQMDLRTGLKELWSGISYPLKHDGLSDEEAQLVVNVLKEFRIITNSQGEWALQDREEVNA